MLNNTPILQADLVRRLHCATGHLQGVADMIEQGADYKSLVHQTLAVHAALREVNHLILKHHLDICLVHCLPDTSPNPEGRERCCRDIVALYHLLNR